uniref:(northern house mosquito) hypothetical protein n=1 Tax=Culex pipiens TaxID=7175 RepID=A0A8D8APM3_CULPI
MSSVYYLRAGVQQLGVGQYHRGCRLLGHRWNIRALNVNFLNRLNLLNLRRLRLLLLLRNRGCPLHFVMRRRVVILHDHRNTLDVLPQRRVRLLDPRLERMAAAHLVNALNADLVRPTVQLLDLKRIF